ncbi:hypothetical protein CONPUDRAFT_75702 [Coniophora puteana RWD-64-598 SS2]|uniref:DUF6534 domain-containing protein n=1 Tax=Coniophora puteana (strain RWD-64-598) TaxID=741705 RepID=A0A5M3MH55_CONPW|nr:uncharacterized protein CONPUDRAFT_75702 [Coniophora puteana RWD-64-598 SS2]EIW77951.1 hypothetical protein CONPUDRAFT_75702 [Coniophora puteana RWD-64-598 SS2]
MSSLEARVAPIIGPLEVGSLVCGILLGCALLQGYFYHCNFEHDPCKRKLLVACVIVVDLFYFFSCAVMLWKLTIIFFGNVSQVEALPAASLSAIAASTAVMNIMMQGFYAHRIWKLSSSVIIPIIIGISTTVSTIIALYGAIGTMVYEPKWLGPRSWIVWVSDSCELFSSLVITCVTAWYLRKSKILALSGTARHIDRLTLWTLEIGLPPSICRIAELVCILRYGDMIWLGPYIIVAGVQANCLLAAINTRMIRVDESIRRDVEETRQHKSLPALPRSTLVTDARNSSSSAESV